MTSVNEQLAKVDATVSEVNNTVSRVISTYDGQITSASTNANQALSLSTSNKTQLDKNNNLLLSKNIISTQDLSNIKTHNSLIESVDKSDLYAQSKTRLIGNIYADGNVEAQCECNCENLVLRAGFIGTDRAKRINRESIICENNDLFVKSNIQVQIGSVNKYSLGFDGGEYYTNAPYGTKEYKTQLFDEKGPITRQLIPKKQRPLNSNDNIFFVINDGMGYNHVWLAKLTADMINKYGNFMKLDVSDDSRINYMDSSGGFTSFKLSWEKNSDIILNYTPLCTEMFRDAGYAYKGITSDRSEQVQDKAINANNKYLVPDSAATASAMATGRLTQNEVVNTINDIDLGSYEGTDVNASTGLIYYKTIHEEAKENGKLICISSTSNVLHATPACFVSKSVTRNAYCNLIRTCFGPDGSNPHLIIGAIPQSGYDVAQSNSSTNVGYDIVSNVDASGNFIARYRCYNFPEIDSTWTTTEWQLDTNGNKCASCVQYAKHYGYTVLDNYTKMMNWLNTTPVLTTSSKIFLANPSGATPAFICNNQNGIGTTSTSVNAGLFKVSSQLIKNSESLRQLNQTEMVKYGLQLLKNHPKGFVWMHENSETDWAGHTGDWFGAAFETLESSKALEQIYADSSLLSKTNVLVGCDHECGGWIFHDINNIPDYTDSQYDVNTYAVLNAYYQTKKVHLVTNFLAIDLNISINDSSKITYDSTLKHFKVDKSLFNNTQPTSFDLNSVSSLDLTNAKNIRDYVLWLFKQQLVNDPTKLIKYLNASLGTSTALKYFRTNIVNGDLYLKSPDSTLTTIDSSANLLSIRLPISLLSSVLLTLNSNNQDSIISNVLLASYNESKLYSINMIGFNTDTDADIERISFNSNFIGGNPYGGSKICKTSLHSLVLKDLAKFTYNGKTIYPIEHIQTVYKVSTIPNENYESYFNQNYSHSSVVCRFWQKSNVLSKMFSDIGINKWDSFSSFSTPAQFLNGKTVSSTSVRYLLDLTI